MLAWLRRSGGGDVVYSRLATGREQDAVPPLPPPRRSLWSLVLVFMFFTMFVFLPLLLVGLRPAIAHHQEQATLLPTPSFVSNSPFSSNQTRVFITATSPFALQRACSDNSAFLSTPLIFHSVNELLKAFTTSSTVCGILDYRINWQQIKDAGVQMKMYQESHVWQAIFDANFANWTRLLVDSQIEDEIDESCLTRRIDTMRRSLCDVFEIAIIRAAMLLLRLHNHQFPMTTIPPVSILQNNKRAMERIKLLLHTSFYDQLVGILPVLSRTIDVPVQRLRPTVDAGSCEILNSNPDADAVGPKARCLPSYIIIGAQKSGTDELSVYLNRNTLFNRRMDGGVEVHFFDCVGRGQGNLDQDKDSFRLSCARLRTSLMGSTNPTSTKGSEQAFTWKEVSKLTPFADELYTHYIKLGQMTARQFTREHRTLVFEKSPSYLDLADVRDVARILPRGKFVFLSRDPVPRLVSAYFQYCEAYDMERASQNCTMQEFEEFTRALVMGKLDITTMDGSLPRRLAFYRGALYGMYNRYLTKWLKYFWVDNKLEEKQFLMVDSSHFKQHPKAVLYAVESFVGLRGQRHFDYSPRMSNGKYIYGESSKALHPTHQSKTLSLEIEQLLREYYRPSVDAFRELLLQERGPIVFGLMYDTFPTSLTSPGNPQIFNSSSRFSLPDWLR